ncbi:MAG: CDP-glycerol glycerophosphotransferase family protein [Coriobacteriales bacterium]
MAAVYAPLKLLPTVNGKIVFLSRQQSTPSLDFRMLQDELRRRDPGVRIVTICNRIGPGLASKLSFALDTLRSMYHLATSSVCVLDTYWPAVSMLDHKPQLTVIQIWHSLGKIKKSGLAAVGKPGGRSTEIAALMRMHANYDYVVAGAESWDKYYCESFGCSKEQLVHTSLPRLDVLDSRDPQMAQEVYARYPELLEGKVVLYAPTFRRTSQPEHSELIETILSEGYKLVVKSHPNQALESGSALTCPEFSAMQLLLVADYLVTDYSAIALEAAAAGVKTFYYLFDSTHYREQNGLNIDLEAEMPGCVFYDVPSLVDGLRRADEGGYPEDVLARFQQKFLIPSRGHSTSDLAQFVLKQARL